MPQVALFRDFREEGWPSMDLVADMELAELPTATHDWKVVDATPAFRRSVSYFKNVKFLQNIDRLQNRMIVLPRAARTMRERFDLFHIVDHSYAHLIHSLPPERSGVYCHDLDSFRCILDPRAEPRPWWFRKLSAHILEGMKKAAIVFFSTQQTADRILHHRLVEPSRLRHAPYGVAREFFMPDDHDLPSSVRSLGDTPLLLHVGSCIPRKRIDLLLRVFEGVRRIIPECMLVKVGDPWTDRDLALSKNLGLEAATVHVGRLSRAALAATYRKAAAVLITSDAEGFGLPVVEALACGTPVVATDLAAIREAGGAVATYVSPDGVDPWIATVCKVLSEQSDASSQAGRRAWASKFSWSTHARIVRDAYRELLS